MNILGPIASMVNKWEICLANGGGTISSAKRKDGFLDIDHGREFHTKFHEDLHEAHLKILEPVEEIFKKRINSENMTVRRLKILAQRLIEIIEKIKDRKLDTKLIVVTFGTDTMDKVVNILSAPRLKVTKHNGEYAQRLNSFIKEAGLKALIDKLNRLIDKYHIRIVFTGSNTDKEKDIKDNFMGACNRVKQIADNHRDHGPGIYISHNNHWIPGAIATKAYKKKNQKWQMNYISRTRNEVHKGKRIANVVQPQIKAIQSKLAELGLKEKFNNETVTYTANEIRDHHDEFKDVIARDRGHNIKAVLLVLYHSGTACTDETDSKTPNASVAKLVREIRKDRDDIAFFAVNENHSEPVTLGVGAYGSSKDLREAGVVPLYDMYQETAEAKLGLLTKRFNTPHELIVQMLKSYADKVVSKSVPNDIDVSLKNQDYIDTLLKDHYPAAAV